MPSFSIPFSGLSADAQALSVISNNLANLNTVGYKDQEVNFRDLFYQQLSTNGSGNSVQTGAGTAVDQVASNFTSGTINSTGVPTDAAISGNGFFITQKGGVLQYTRAGNFAEDSSGSLITQNGSGVLGYPAVKGVIDTTQGLSPVQISKSSISPAVATTSVHLQTNLDASAKIGDSYYSPVTVYDSLGTSHMLNFQFTKTAANTWGYKVIVPAADTGSATPTVVNSGSVGFDGNGKLISVTDSAGVVTSPPADVAGITVAGLVDGASAMTFTWKLLDASGTPVLSQLSSASNTSATNQNGYSSGTLTNFNINADGIVEGSFSNGQTMALGQIALASFGNSQGLRPVGDNCFEATLASGAPAVGAPGTGILGDLQGGALEASNVDLAKEFTNLITAQRGYQANARVVTTFDDLAQDLLNMKR